MKNKHEERADKSKVRNSTWMEERSRRKNDAKEESSEEIRGCLGKI